MQVLCLEGAEPALPPATHGGSIDARALASEGTQWFLDHPEESLLEQGEPKVKFQAKVHIAPGEALEFCKLLVSRNICTWVLDDDVLEVGGQKVLNGMFAVGKGSFVGDSHVELQRTIMNLIPTNAVFSQSQGGTSNLPAITQYLSLVLQGDECLRYFQSDMSSAFYLFRIPTPWSRMMAFNIAFDGKFWVFRRELYLDPDVQSSQWDGIRQFQ